MIPRSSASLLRAASEWRSVQITSAAVGLAVLLALLLRPGLGLRLFWNLVMPLLPALLVFVPGWWRNSCPLATCTLVGKTIQQWLLPTGSPATTRRIQPSRRSQGIAALGGVIFLALLLPARHLIFDRHGAATAILLFVLMAAAAVQGALFLKKSGWCAGWCPVQPVEKLYGQSPALPTVNARCGTCSHCVVVCPDSDADFKPLRSTPTPRHRAADLLMAGGFAGFVWGWFQVPLRQAGDFADSSVVALVLSAYGMPLAGAAMSLVVFVALRTVLPQAWHPLLVRASAALAVGCFYWYRLPALFGFPEGDSSGVLIDLSAVLPSFVPWISRLLTSLLFGGWLMSGLGSTRWMARPPSRIPLRRSLESARRLDVTPSPLPRPTLWEKEYSRSR